MEYHVMALHEGKFLNIPEAQKNKESLTFIVDPIVIIIYTHL